MDSKLIRAKFLEFFKGKEHQIVPSAPLVIKNDPTLMFTNAGMNQFKDYFLGNQEPRYLRIADTQKCLRVSGKHNDLEEVGLDTYHHTMFEMLGNWSFGNYFKKEAISWAWELLTEVYRLPKERMYVTVFEGDKSEDLDFDQEAFDLWKQFLPEERILNGNKKDNFWEMGDVGPCGPCSEIHIDLRTEAEIKKISGKSLVNNDHPQVVEIWNLVFIQYNRQASGKLVNLPAKHVDTGMGFERLVMAIQGKQSNYDTDVFQPLIQKLAASSGIAYGQEKGSDIAMRVIVDHIRATAFAIADGQLPSNNKAGYVIRRILRRAIRYGYTYLNFKVPFIYTLVPALAEQFDGVFPELKQQQDFVAKVLHEEEAAFLRTLEVGLKRFEEEREKLKAKGDREIIIPGFFAFELYDTFGFPLDLTQLIASENNMKVDEDGFRENMKLQKERSRSAAAQETGDWTTVGEKEEESSFIGYETLESPARILRYREIKEKGKSRYQVVLDKTPFYAESGGQIGDTGYLKSDQETIRVEDTKKENELTVHFVDKLPENPSSIFTALVDEEKRKLTENNHSATHLLHAALKSVLGSHVQQKGSLVNEEVLRFDFSHFSKMTEEEIRKVEQIVNRKIRENIPLSEQRNVPIEKAKELGAMALFGEKYGEFVRVITFDKNYSIELCGGTHVPATGKIGYFKIISEGSVATGVRRIEAITAEGAQKYISSQLDLLEEAKAILKNPQDFKQALQNLVEEKNQLSKQVEAMQMKQATALSGELIANAFKINDTSAIVEQVNLPSTEALKKLAFDLKNKFDSLFLVLAANIDDKPQIAVMVSEDLIESKKLNAGQIVRELAKEIKGGGGGQPFFATAGGKDINGLNNLLQKAKEIVEEKLK